MGEKPAAAPAAGRLKSIDALRGFDMFWIMGGDAAWNACVKWIDPSSRDVLLEQMEHVKWEGFHFYDLIFPLFLFVVGAVIPFSLESHRQRGESRAALYGRIARRVALLFLLGLICNGILQFDWQRLRVAGVLQRIAICYGIAALVVMWCGVRGQVVVSAAILLGYWAILALVPVPGSTAGDYSIQGNLAGYLDRHFLPGRIVQEYYGFGDNEGLLSTIPAVATALLGALAGQWLRSARRPGVKVLGLLAAGVAALLLGTAWGMVFPVIKNLWTSSYVLVAGGWSLLLLALFYAVIDVAGYSRWAFFFIVIGMNAITIYVVPRFLDFPKIAQFFLGGTARYAERGATYFFSDQLQHPELTRAVVLAFGVLAAKWLFLLYLYRRRLFLRV